MHAKRTGESLSVREPRETPLETAEWQVELDKSRIGPNFRQHAKVVEGAVLSTGQEERCRFARALEQGETIRIEAADLPNGYVDLSRDIVKICRQTRIENVREYVPNVIEPSFGIGRIMYSILEHSFWSRPNDKARSVLTLPAIMAPTKVLILPLMSRPDFVSHTRNISRELRRLGISNTVDSSSGSIGRRYARNDELGTPLGITVDFDTVKDGSVTLRERDTMKQVRVSQDEILATLVAVVNGMETVPAAFNRLPEFLGQSDDDPAEVSVQQKM